MISASRSAASGWFGSRLTPKGLSVRDFTFAMAARSSSSVIVALARMPSPPADEVAAVSVAPDTHPMPVCTIGSSTPNPSETTGS